MCVETPLKISCERRQLFTLIWEGIACSDIKGTKYDRKAWEGGRKKERNLLPFFNDSSNNPEVIGFTNDHHNDNSCFYTKNIGTIKSFFFFFKSALKYH